MFDLQNKKPDQPFQFDLEIELKNDPNLAKALLKEVESRMGELKNLLRQGAETEDFDEYGVMLHGYAALQKVLKKVTETK